MNIAIIACHVFNRELSMLCAASKNTIRVFWLEQGLHDTPEKLRKSIQTKIDEIEEYNNSLNAYNKYRAFDSIVLAYGLCSNGTIGLKSSKLPIVIPKCDDCIALFLGSQERYIKEFSSREGIYWYNQGWIETSFTPSGQHLERRRNALIEMYGEDNAQYILESENGWIKEYKHCIYIKSPFFPREDYEAYTKEAAECYGWQYTALDGDNGMLQKLTDGEWDDKNFLVCPPQSVTKAAYDGSKISYDPA